MRRFIAVLLISLLYLSLLVLPVRAQNVRRRPIVAGGATFPVNGVLDNFNRANENPATGWTIALSGLSNIQVISNRAQHGGGTAYAAWSAGTFAADQGAYIEMPVAPVGLEAVGILLRWNNLNTGTETGYMVQQLGAVVRAYRIDTGISFTQLGSDISYTPTNGDSFGGKIVGSTITIYTCASGAGCGVSGPGWTVLDTRSDATYSNAGYIGVHSNTGTPPAMDNFGGGAQ